MPLGLFLVFTVVEHARGRWMLHRRLAELSAQGEKLRVSELMPPPVAADRNTVADLLPMTNRVSLLISNFGLLPPGGHISSLGRHLVASRLTSWSDKEGTNAWERIHQALHSDAEVLRVVQEAMQKPGWDDGFNYRNGFVDFKSPPFVLWKQLVQVLQMASLDALRQSRTEEAVQRNLDALQLVKRQEESRLVISELVRLACAAITWGCTWEILQSQTCTEAQLARLQSAWMDQEFHRPMAHALEMERAMTLEHFDLVLGSARRLHNVVAEAEATAEFGLESLPTSGFVLRHIHAPFWRIAWARQDELRSLNRWQAIVEFDRGVQNSSWAREQELAALLDSRVTGFFAGFVAEGDLNDSPSVSFYDRMRFLFSNMSFSIGSGPTKRSTQAEVQQRLMITAIALERHRLKHAKYPETLTALVPDRLNAIPLDPMDGQPLRYRVDSATAFTLYSVGLDGQDDGGDASISKESTVSSLFWKSRDALWPSPASAEEAAKAARGE